LDVACYLNSIIYFFHTNIGIFVQFFPFLTDNRSLLSVLRFFNSHFIYFLWVNFVGIFAQFFLFLTDNHNFIFIVAFLWVHFI